jgi:hypothetical protein
MFRNGRAHKALSLLSRWDEVYVIKPDDTVQRQDVQVAARLKQYQLALLDHHSTLGNPL